MHILLTGGSGDLGTLVAPSLENLGHTLSNLDMAPPKEPHGEFVQGSILDRQLLEALMSKVECIIHIAALHGIHEFKNSASLEQFWDVNVTGTFNLLHAARNAGVKRFIFISSTSVDEVKSIYGQTKILAESACQMFTSIDADFSVIVLRPRAFIPYWNRNVYDSEDELKNFVAWAQWFWKGAVHIDDVAQSVVKSVELLSHSSVKGCPILLVDGKYDYSADDLENWDSNGPGSTFVKKYGEQLLDLAMRHGLDPSRRPQVLDASKTCDLLGYAPRYSLRDLLGELEKFGVSDPG
jgi:nucleoside-diphosphate-sugar epimerase